MLYPSCLFEYKRIFNVDVRLGRFFGIPKNTGFFEKPVFRFCQTPNTEKPKKPEKDEKSEETDMKMASQRAQYHE